jgi:hypothetical protein
MTDSGRLSCEQLRECVAELALGVLPARERATAVAHLQDCPSCCEAVRELALTADGLLDLIPGTEPPIGFEARVLQRIGVPRYPLRHSRTVPPHSQQPPRTRWQRLALLGAAAVLAFGVGAGGWAIGNSSGAHAPAAPSAPASTGPALRTAALTMAGGRAVGQVFAYPGRSPWVYMSVDAEEAGIARDAMVRCQLQLGVGSTVSIGTFALTGGYGHWGGAYPDGSAPVSGVRLLTSDGSVLATATFPAAKSDPGATEGLVQTY